MKPLQTLSCACIASLLTAGPAAGDELLLTNATLIDGSGSEPVMGATVRVSGGRIAEVRLGARTDTAAAGTIDLRGRCLLPGLIDAHAHIQSPASARRALMSGVTTARVLGDSYLQGLGTRDLIRRGYAQGPELLVSGGHVRPRLGEPFFVAFPQFGQYLSGELKGPENVAAVVRVLLDRGVDVIKVGASERAGLASTDPRRQELSFEEMQAAVREASRAHHCPGEVWPSEYGIAGDPVPDGYAAQWLHPFVSSSARPSPP